MLTTRRLDKALKTAREFAFNNDSRLILFSDVHRGDNSLSDEFSHNSSVYYHALHYYYQEGFTYIELGDGDELWEFSRYHDILYAHSDVRVLLSRFHKAKRFVMVYGNHNIFLKNKRYISRNLYTFYDEYEEKQKDLFPGLVAHEALRMIHTPTGTEIFALHGHQGDLLNDQIWPLSLFLLRYLWRIMHIIGFRNPVSPARSARKQHKIEKNFSRWITARRMPILCGHTHRPRFPADGDPAYLNTGCCIHPRGITGIEIVDGKIQMVDWRIRPDDKGMLGIHRHVMRGPVRVGDLKTGTVKKPAE